MKTIAHLVTFC